MAKAEQIFLVSVIVPSYNRAALVERAVASAFAQEGVDVEVIVVDDGSTDSTPEILRQLAAQYGTRLRIHVQRNTGASAARNAGLDLAEGDFVQFLDSDDTLEPDKLRIQKDAFLSDPTANVVLCFGWMEQDGVETRVGVDLGCEPQQYIEMMWSRAVHVVPTRAPLWRRSYLTCDRRWDSELSLGDDLEFTIRCLAASSHIVFVPLALFRIREHGGDRLSDFSLRADRLASLMQSRIKIFMVLTAYGRWSNECARNTVIALRTIYIGYLQRMSAAEITGFEQSANAMCGSSWRSPSLISVSWVRRYGGPQLTMKFSLLAFRVTAASRLFVRKVLSPTVWTWRFRRLITRLTAACDLKARIKSARAFADVVARDPDNNEILYVEPNTYHAEVIPGIVSLLEKAGYQITILHRLELPVQDAVVRLSNRFDLRFYGLSLPDMRRFLRSNSVAKYAGIFLGSGLIAENHGYFGGMLDYVGAVPNGNKRHLVIEHDLANYIARQDSFRSESVFALRPTKSDGSFYPMLAPVCFGSIAPVALAKPVIFVVVGRLECAIRDVNGLFEAVRELVKAGESDFQVHLIGGETINNVPHDLRAHFRALGRLSFEKMYDALDKAHFLLPALDSQTETHRPYLRFKTTGSRQLSLGFLKPMVIDREFASCYGFTKENTLIHNPGGLQWGLEAACQLNVETYLGFQESLRSMKNEVTGLSLVNLRAQLQADQ